MSLAPAAPHERIVVLDVLRGIALLGVLLGNGFYLYSGFFAGSFGGYEPTQIDQVASWFVQFLVQSKAQTLLTFLFGLGFAMQLLRAQARGEPVVGLYVRRMLALFLFGALHVVILWWGDVLWTYAVAGLALLLFHRASNRTRLVAGALLTFVPAGIMAVPEVREFLSTLIYGKTAWPEYTAQLLAAMRGPDHLDLMWQHMRFAPMFSAGGFWWYEPWLVGRFLLGQVAGALRWFERDGAQHRHVFRRLLLGGAIAGGIGLTVSVLRTFGVIDKPEGVALPLVFLVVREMNFLGLATFYLAATVLLFQRPRWRRLLSVFAPTGRMPLTVYVGQSLIMTALLYGWALGWMDFLAPAAYVPLAFAVFAVQTVLCHLWLRRYQFGPLEWLWRGLVYMRLPAMRV